MKGEEGVTVTTGAMAFVARPHKKNRTLLQESVALGLLEAGSRPASNALMVARQATNKCSALGKMHSMKGFWRRGGTWRMGQKTKELTLRAGGVVVRTWSGVVIA